MSFKLKRYMSHNISLTTLSSLKHCWFVTEIAVWLPTNLCSVTHTLQCAYYARHYIKKHKYGYRNAFNGRWVMLDIHLCLWDGHIKKRTCTSHFTAHVYENQRTTACLWLTIVCLKHRSANIQSLNKWKQNSIPSFAFRLPTYMLCWAPDGCVHYKKKR